MPLFGLVKKEGDEKEDPKGSKAGADMVALDYMHVTLAVSVESAVIPNLADTSIMANI
jgi:hypothetical protein